MIDWNRSDRAVAPIVGFVILFGVFILLLTLWQVQVVPDQNANTEFEHQQDVTGDLVDLRDAIQNAPQRGSTQQARVQLGTQYTDRTLFVNPPDPQGSLQTVDERNDEPLTVRIGNAEADDETAGVETAWNGSDRTFNTSVLAYQPRYTELPDSPQFVAEHSVLYADYGDSRINHTEQRIVEEDTVSVVALGGTLNEGGTDESTVVADPLGDGLRSVQVTNDTAAPIELELPTFRTERVSEDVAETEWEGLLGPQLQENVQDVSVSDGNVTIELEPGNTYDLELARTDVSNPSASAAGDPAYVAVTSFDERVLAGVPGELTVEVRDGFDNALAGENVTVSTPDEEINATTRRDGAVTVEYTPENTGTQTVSISHENATDVSLDIDVVETTGSGASSVVWTDGDEKLVDDDPIELTAESTIGDRPVEFAVEDTDVVEINVTSDDDFEDGEATASFDVDLNEGGVYVYVSSGGEGDRLELLPSDSTFTVSIEETNDPILEGDVLEVDVEIENTGTTAGTQTIELEVDGVGEVDSNSVTLEAGENTTRRLEWATEDGDASENIGIEVTSDDDFDTRQVTVDSTQLSALRATSVIPNANDQMQTFEFTVGDELPTEEAVHILLGDGDGADKIDYGAVNAVLLDDEGEDAGVNLDTIDGEQAIVYGEGEPVTAETAVEIRAEGLAVGGAESIYEVRFNRTDTDQTIDRPFAISNEDGQPELENLTVTDLYDTPGDTTQEQQISFTPTTDMVQLEDVIEFLTIGLTEAQESDLVDYEEDGFVQDVSVGQDASLIEEEGKQYIRYEMPDEDPLEAGTSVNITLGGVDATVDPEDEGTEFDVGFSRGTADTDRASFGVFIDEEPPTVTPVSPTDGETVSDDQVVIEAAVSDDESGVDADSIRVTVEDDEGEQFGDAGVDDEGVDFEDGTLTIDIGAKGESYETGAVDVDVIVEDTVGNTATEEWTFTLVPATVEVVAQDSLGNNDEIDTSFVLDNPDGSTVDVDVLLDFQNPQQGWNSKEVTIDGDTYELIEDAADDIGRNLDAVDLFDATNYEDTDQSELDNKRDSITLDSEVTNVDQNGDSDLNIEIVEG